MIKWIRSNKTGINGPAKVVITGSNVSRLRVKNVIVPTKNIKGGFGDPQKLAKQNVGSVPEINKLPSI